MTAHDTEPQADAEVVNLRAVPAGPGTGLAAGQATYADVTAPGERRPVLPHWLRSRDAAKHHARRVTGAAAHTAAYHAVRSPVYAVHAAFWAPVGVFRLAARWLRWWLFPVPMEVYADAVADGHRAWHRASAVHREMSKNRALISLAFIIAAALAARFGGPYVPWWGWAIAAAAALPVLARFGRPASVRIVGHATVPPEYEVLTQDVIVRALGSLGLAGINQWVREGREFVFTGPVRQDGPGWRAELDLPYGTTAAQVIDRRSQFASGLRRPLGAVWPEPVTSQHEGRLEIWVGQQDITARKPVPWPLLKAGTADVFKTVPFGTDTRGRKVDAPLVYHNYLIGSQPRNGKTGTVRELACAAALDPLCGLWVAELKGSGDLDPLEKVSHRFVSGIDDDSIGYAAESLQLLRREIEKRTPKVRGLPADLCPDRKVTREIAKRHAALRPIVAIVDEAQLLFTHDKYGKQAGADAEFIIKVGPAMGVVLVIATQRPDAKSLPTGVSANASVRFCMYVADQTSNDMVLGTSSYKAGIRATQFRPETDAGLGWLKGATREPKVVRTYYMNAVECGQVAARARAVRERAGTLTGAAVGEDDAAVVRDPVADALAVFSGEKALHWGQLAERLAARWPDRWAGATAESVSAELRAAGVSSVQVYRSGQNRQGCRRGDLEALGT